MAINFHISTFTQISRVSNIYANAARKAQFTYSRHNLHYDVVDGGLYHPVL